MLSSIENLPTWALAGAYAAVWLAVAVLVRRGLRRWLTRLASSWQNELGEVLAASLPRPAAIAVFLAALSSGVQLLPLPDHLTTELHRWFGGALAIIGVAALMRVTFHAIDAYGRSNPGLRSSSGVGKAVTWVAGLAIVAVLVSDALGISLAPALTALGVGSLAVALALQDTLANFFSGLYIIAEKPFRPGDFVRVDPNYEGYVDSIGWRSTHLRTLGSNLVVIPNATLSKAVITNYSMPTPAVASTLRVDVGPDADIDAVEAALADEALACPRRPRDGRRAEARRRPLARLRRRRRRVHRLILRSPVHRSDTRAACPSQAHRGSVQARGHSPRGGLPAVLDQEGPVAPARAGHAARDDSRA